LEFSQRCLEIAVDDNDFSIDRNRSRIGITTPAIGECVVSRVIREAMVLQYASNKELIGVLSTRDIPRLESEKADLTRE